MSTEKTLTGTIQISTYLEKGLERMVSDLSMEIVKVLGEQYGFSAEDAMRNLNIEQVSAKTTKAKKKTAKVLKPAFPLPFTGKNEESCCGLKLNHSLYTQCQMKPSGEGEFCKTCQKQADMNSSGKPNYGTVDDRLAVGVLEYRDPKGKQVLPYANVMEKLGVTQTTAEEEAKKFGIVIPEEQFEKRESLKGRPKKTTAAEDTDDEGVGKKAGRPKKMKTVVSNPGDDMIAALVANVENGENSSIIDGQKNVSRKKSLTDAEKEEKRLALEQKKAEKAEKEAEKEVRRIEREAAKALKDAELAEKRLAIEKRKQEAAEKKAAKDAEKEKNRVEREAAKALKDSEKETKRLEIEERKKVAAARKAEKDAELAEKRLATEQKKKEASEKKAAKEAEKEARRVAAEQKKKETAEKKAEKEAQKAAEAKAEATELVQQIEAIKDELAEEPIEDDDEEELAVSKFEHDGVTYLKSEDNSLYNPETQEFVAVWNPELKQVEDPDEDSDSENED